MAEKAEQQQPQQPKPGGISPFSDNVIEKPYSALNVSASPEELAGRIPEPVYNAPSIGREDPYANLSNGGGGNTGGGNSGGNGDSSSVGRPGGGKQSGTQPPPPINPHMNNLSNEEVKVGAEALAKIIVDSYEALHPLANKMLQVTPKELNKLEAEGEIDLQMQIPYEVGQTISAAEFFAEMNETNKDLLTVSKEFKKEVIPVLTRVLAKRGAGLTDEQHLVYIFGKDIAVKGMIIYQVKNSIKEIVEMMKQQKSDGTGFTESSQPRPERPADERQSKEQVRQQPAGKRQYKKRGQDIPDPARMNFDNNETVVESSVRQMQVPSTGKARAMAQQQKEKRWETAGQNSNDGSSDAKQRYKDRQKTGKRDKSTVVAQYLAASEKEIADAIVLSETPDLPTTE
jgi:hypothetical protein